MPNAPTPPVRAERLDATPQDAAERFAFSLWNSGRKTEAVEFLERQIARHKVDSDMPTISLAPNIEVVGGREGEPDGHETSLDAMPRQDEGLEPILADEAPWSAVSSDDASPRGRRGLMGAATAVLALAIAAFFVPLDRIAALPEWLSLAKDLPVARELTPAEDTSVRPPPEVDAAAPATQGPDIVSSPRATADRGTSSSQFVREDLSDDTESLASLGDLPETPSNIASEHVSENNGAVAVAAAEPEDAAGETVQAPAPTAPVDAVADESDEFGPDDEGAPDGAASEATTLATLSEPAASTTDGTRVPRPRPSPSPEHIAATLAAPEPRFVPPFQPRSPTQPQPRVVAEVVPDPVSESDFVAEVERAIAAPPPGAVVPFPSAHPRPRVEPRRLTILGRVGEPSAEWRRAEAERLAAARQALAERRAAARAWRYVEPRPQRRWISRSSPWEEYPSEEYWQDWED